MAPIPKNKPSSKNGSKKDGVTKALSKKSKNRLSKPQTIKPQKSHVPQKKKKRVYTEKELGIPKLNMITPVGVEKPKGKRKGKVFVDDQESMMTILAMVNADKEGQIESKMIKARQLEEIREARRKEAEARQVEKRSKLEETKDSLRKKRNRQSDTAIPLVDESSTAKAKSTRKRVSFR
ncbi:hypothetical protein M501DRAFT_205872 [Patellaria atrata CBS 101060]|uniref:60S ribosomal subunit assembly/export protein LOC1 n=1 Tax=Patellaria atrata CBS 101060 TaxID=1346257 RepID=A0A9P4S821_9PEZI|nr:hypothetical protein M501DRAFT_205872 [Patellaria atrata CBS 101060]